MRRLPMITSHFLRIFRSIIVLSILTLFVGCGGGGGGKDSPEPTFTISGTVSGAIQQGVTITLSGDSSDTTTTDASGYYSFPDLVNGSYTIIPSVTPSSLIWYSFTPFNKAVTINKADVGANDFTSTENAVLTFSISGTITVNSVAQQGVTVTLSGSSGTATTDANGNYSFQGLTYGVYLVTPSFTGYTFSPTSQYVTIYYDADHTGINFQ
jgi:hypothetical protein